MRLACVTPLPSAATLITAQDFLCQHGTQAGGRIDAMNRDVPVLMAEPVLTVATPLGSVLVAHVSGPAQGEGM